jgi:hypothetical protein
MRYTYKITTDFDNSVSYIDYDLHTLKYELKQEAKEKGKTIENYIITKINK